MKWKSVKDECPAIGQCVILCLNDVVQKETYTFDASDIDDYTMEYFWSRDDVDDCCSLKDDQHWMSLPDSPKSEQGDLKNDTQQLQDEICPKCKVKIYECQWHCNKCETTYAYGQRGEPSKLSPV